MTLHIEIDRDKPGQLTRALQLHRGRWPFHCHYTDATRALKRLTSRATWLFVQQLVQANTETDELCITDRFLKGNTIVIIGFTHKWPVMPKAFPYRNVTIETLTVIWQVFRRCQHQRLLQTLATTKSSPWLPFVFNIVQRKSYNLGVWVNCLVFRNDAVTWPGGHIL